LEDSRRLREKSRALEEGRNSDCETLRRNRGAQGAENPAPPFITDARPYSREIASQSHHRGRYRHARRHHHGAGSVGGKLVRGFT